MPLAAIEAYDVFFTKERYAMRSLQQVGIRNLAYLPMYCVPSEHYPVTPTADEARRYGGPISFVGNRYPYRERFVKALRDYPLRLWGRGWAAAEDPAISSVAGPAVFGHEKLLVYAASALSLNHHHPMNDIVGVNTRAFELAAAAACQIVDLKEDLQHLFKPGEEIVGYRDLAPAPARLLSGASRRGARDRRERPPARARRAHAPSPDRRDACHRERPLRQLRPDVGGGGAATAGMTSDSLAESLTCIECGAAYPLTYRLECARCRGLLELRYDVARLRALGPGLLSGSGLWRYAPVLPIADPAHRLTLGEGGTPLLDCPRLAAAPDPPDRAPESP